MVLTRMQFRGQGLARRLLTEALTLCDQMKIETIKLDATDQGQPLYEKFGFREEQGIERWSGPGSTKVAYSSAHLSEAAAITDLAAFGADRSAFSRDSREEILQFNQSSYAFTRPGREIAYLGPVYARIRPRQAHCSTSR